MAGDTPGEGSTPSRTPVRRGRSTGQAVFGFNPGVLLVLVIGAVLAVAFKTSGWLAIAGDIVLALAVAYLLYLAFAFVGAAAFITWFTEGMQRSEAKLHEGQEHLQIRMPLVSRSEPASNNAEFNALFDALNTALAPDGECVSMTAGPRQLHYNVYGSDLDHLIAACRSTASHFNLPPGAHLWRPDGPRTGERLDL